MTLALHSSDRIGVLLLWIGILSVSWTLAHGWRLWTQWHRVGVKPGTIGGGLWMLFACLSVVALVGTLRRLLPESHAIATIAEFALLGVALALSWLVVQLVRVLRESHDRRSTDR